MTTRTGQLGAVMVGMLVAGMLAGAGASAVAQEVGGAPAPGMVRYQNCETGEWGWAPASHPAVLAGTCSPYASRREVDAATPRGPWDAIPPGATFVLGEYYRSPYPNEIWHVIGIVQAQGMTLFVLENMRCNGGISGELGLWATDAPRGPRWKIDPVDYEPTCPRMPLDLSGPAR